MERAQLSIRDMPEVERAAKCALPIVFTSLDHPEYPGIQGTSTAVRFGPDVVFLTAAHVLASNTERTIVEVALGFQGEPVRSRIGSVLKPRPADARYEAQCDFAVMFPQAPPALVQNHIAEWS